MAMGSMKKRFRQFFAIYSGFSEILARISIVICYGLVSAVTIIVGLAVFYRYVLNSPLQWAEEIARYILIWLSLIAASVAVKERKHINLTTVIRRLPQPVSLVIEIILYGIIIGVIAIIARYSWEMVVTRSLRQFSPSMAISMLWAHSALPVGFALILLQSLFILLEDITLLLKENE
ncbi:TRAP transporter small permease subunit [candidate division KSB3 bacterium]|uniref:TRAP transporter small permease subunit n=1 Tax=candidate division KSB3 bacterium TaxID=2044937 RepID=A0A9D5JUN1_9BACT|nr:TRAP transporter small permease subunit [candidate division KSB3 bacterium]MBD3324453.1 TRAP transporter small permease subunit [candidate division KSB3 bacterium]